MAHNNNCKMFRLAMDTFIKARPAEFLTAAELRVLMALAPPCHECSPLSSQLSPLSGRLYKIVWDKHRCDPVNPPASIVDMFHD